MLFLILFLYPVISEVMNNPPGSESESGKRNEWIEIYNPGPDTVDLSLFGIIDFDTAYDPVDSIIAWKDSSILKFHPGVIIGKTKLPPYRFGIILDPDYTDTLNQDHPQPYVIFSGTYIFTVSDRGLGNEGAYGGLSSSDPIALFELQNPHFYVSTFGLNGIPNSSDGISIERKILSDPDSLSNWALSLSPDGSTPGRRNSVSPGPDLVFGKVYIKPSYIKRNSDFNIIFYIKNIGDLNASNPSGFIKIKNTFNFSIISDISPSDSLKDSLSLNFDSTGIYEVFLKINALPDEVDTFNNTFESILVIDKQIFFVSEIFYMGYPEWIEFKNNLKDTLNLKYFFIMDEAGNRADFPDVNIPPDTYFIITSDTGEFRLKFGNIPYTLEIKNFPSLNNDGDLILIRSNIYERIDSVPYEPDWGGDYEHSLEKFNEGYGWLKENWGTSQSISGATPGRGPEIKRMGMEKLKLSSKRFTPNGDGKDDILEIWIAPSNEPSSLYVYDSAGFLKYTFFENQIITYPKLLRIENNYMGLKRGLYILVLKQGRNIYKKTFVYFE